MKKLIINNESMGNVKAYGQNREARTYEFNMENGALVIVPFESMKRFTNDKDFNLDITTLENWR